MKKNVKFLTFLLAAVAIVFVSSCSKDDDNSSGGTEFKKPSGAATVSKIKIPTALQNSTNPYAMMASSYIQSAVSMTSAFSSFEVPSGASHSTAKSTASEDVWYWTDGSSKFWMTYWEDGSKYYWKCELSLAGAAKYTVLTAEEKKDGTGGEVKYYAAANTIALTYTWTYVNNVLTVNMDVEGFSLDIVINADGSGTVDYVAGEDNFHMVWDAAGSGSITGTSSGESYEYSWTA
jgi:hypothetical protein